MATTKKKLAGYVHVNGQAYGPEDDLPKDVAEQVTNPKAWASSADDSDDGSVPLAYEDMETPQLKATAKERGVEVKRGATDAEIVEALRQADADGSAPQ